MYPGPTIRARKGRAAIVRQKNRLPFDTNVHLHGGYVPAAHDGHPMDVILPGKGFDYVYPNDQDAAFLWYHDHAHGRTARTLYYGLVATYLLGDEREEELELPQGEYDVPLVLADHAFNRDGSFRYEENVDLGFRGDTLLVNGAVSPRMRVERRIYRLRFLNASNARSYDLRLGQGRHDAADRQRRRPARAARRAHEHPPASRPSGSRSWSTSARFRPGSEIVLQNAGGDRRRHETSCASTSSAAAAARRRGCPTGRMRTLEKLPEPNATPPLGPLAGHVVGRPVADRPARVRLRRASTCARGWGRRELWQWHNPSNRVHPMHLHGMLFRIVERSTGVIHPGERAWKDTIGVLPGETATVQPWFAPYAGRYVFHCHALEHGDKAMMLQLEVER